MAETITIEVLWLKL